MLITSPANQQLKRARQVREGREPGVIFVEGERLCEECLQSGLELIAGYHIPSLSPRAQSIIAELRRRNCPIYEVAELVLTTVSDTVSTQGIIILAARPTCTLEQVFAPREGRAALMVALDAVQDPGNVGTIVRTAEAAGANGVVALAGTAEAFAPKTLRSAMGSAFRLPLITDVAPDELIAACQSTGLAVVATSADALMIYSDYDWRRPVLIIFGNEAQGIRPELLAHCEARIRIPLQPPVESLNVGAAAAVILFEAERQRRQSGVRSPESGV
jgi:TrmH family RNA methyltransferase